MKRRNKIEQEITRNEANVFSFYAIIEIEHGFSLHEHSPGPLGDVENRGLRPRFSTPFTGLACVEVLRPSQPNGVMSSAVSLPNHTFTGQA